jgi:hypothetical protein
LTCRHSEAIMSPRGREGNGPMPPSVSNLSLKRIEAIRLGEDGVCQARHPVWVETRQVKGYFDALPLRDLCKEREDLNYIPKVVRNADRGDIPGFTFDQDGDETLNDYFKALDKELNAVAGTAAAVAAGEG